MNSLLLRILMMLALVFTAARPALATLLPDDEAQKIQGVIVTQLAAFADDDADGAFQTATPAVREAIGTSGLFLALVRGAYPMVYRPASVTFHKPEQEGARVLQFVEIKDADDKSWLALFAMEKQPDASWRISGCVVAENRWQSI